MAAVSQAVAELERDHEQLQRALESRIMIERARGSPPSRPSQLIRTVSSCAGTPETTTPVCGEPLRRSLLLGLHA